MIGCLGGLGRSFSRWMITRGARKFVFLGRSGTDKAPARRLVEDLQQLGAKVKVVRGDVASANDVTCAVEAVKGTIGGVIQAAMGLGEALFTAMPQESWQSSLAPNIQGTWNLHNAIRGRDSDLDFFLMTSSVSGSVGTATESNYCSASYFLDTFARYRQSLGLPATAIGLGMISGAISEDEMLQIVDISLSTQRSSACDYDVFSGSHVLTGLEATGLKELKAKGFKGVSPVKGDPRASLLAASLDWTDEKTQSKAASGLPSEVAAAMELGEGVREAVLSVVAKKFSNLVLVREDKLNVAKPIGDIGVDSMLAAEFRSWIFQTFKADVPYLALLATSTTLASLAKFITESISSHD
ncbi:KR domain-containing protein [Xylaria flabelliformis]|nr:KR domain-containing protein [Xylaria flabelliformis]